MASALYMADYNGMYYAPPFDTIQYGKLDVYLYKLGYIKTDKIMRCPANAGKFDATDYSSNYYITNPNAVRLITRPSTIIMMVDGGKGVFSTGQTSGTSPIKIRHSGVINILWADFHVSLYKLRVPEQIPDAYYVWWLDSP